MSRIWIGCGLVSLVATAVGGCCYPGSPYCQNSYPNMVGYTYPNWTERNPLVTPPNPPPDGVPYGYVPQGQPGAQIIENGGVPNGPTTAPSFGTPGSETRVPTEIAPGPSSGGDNWVPRSGSGTR